MITTGVEFKGDIPAGQDWVGYAKSQLDILLRQMSLARPKPLNEGARVVSPLPGVTVTCISSFGSTQVVIDVAEGRRKPRIVREQKKQKYEYLKLFAHVDMFTFNTWYSKWWSDTHFQQYIEGDILAREQIVSGIGCAIVSLNGTGPSTSSFVLSELLAYSGTGLAWASVVGDNGLYADTEVNNIIEYYNSLFASFTGSQIVPDIEAADNWFDVQDKSHSWSFTGILYALNEYNPLLGYNEYEAVYDDNAIETGWCNRKWLSWRHKYILPPWKIVTTDWAYDLSRCLLTENVYDFRCVKWHRNFNEYMVDEDSDQPNDRDCYFIVSPVSGCLWYSLTRWMETYTVGDETVCPDLSSGNDITGTEYILDEMLEWCDDLTNASYPYTYRRMLPFKGYLNLHDNLYNASPKYRTIINDEKLNNYYLPDGFCYSFMRYGGVLQIYAHSSEYVCTSGGRYENTDNITLRTLMKFNLAAGYFGNSPWEDRTYHNLHNAVSDLVGQTIVKLGGVVYDNSTIPFAVNDNEKNFAVERHGFSDIDFKTLPGLLYASPCFNIKIYGIPITEEEYKAVRYADDSN